MTGPTLAELLARKRAERSGAPPAAPPPSASDEAVAAKILAAGRLAGVIPHPRSES